MDSITSTVISGVIWFFAGSVGAVVIYFFVAFGLAGGLGALINKRDRSSGYAAGVAFGILPAWFASIVWEVFVAIQVIIHIVTLINLIIAGAN
jgi:hypothetical protein